MSRNDHPRDDLIRMVPLPATDSLIRADNGDEKRTLVGTPIVFNQWTEINGWEGNFLERVDRGAATKTLKERRDQVKVLFNHGFDPVVGDKPLGKPAVMEPRDTGVWTETPLADTSYNKDLIELLDIGAIDGMSFRFSVSRDEWIETPEASDYNPKGLPERTIKEFKLYEFGPVTFPAYEATTAGVRARDAYLAYRQAKNVEPPEGITPSVTIIEDSPKGERETVAPDTSPPDANPDDTPLDSEHLSVTTELTSAAMKRQIEFQGAYLELIRSNSNR